MQPVGMFDFDIIIEIWEMLFASRWEYYCDFGAKGWKYIMESTPLCRPEVFILIVVSISTDPLNKVPRSSHCFPSKTQLN